MTTDVLLDHFAIRSFRDVGDGDYIAARMAHRGKLDQQFLWAGLQALEKYLKCILLLNRIKASDVRHDLGLGMKRINESGAICLTISPSTSDLISYLDTCGRFRYFEMPYYTESWHLFYLDRAVWELRQYCTVTNYGRKTADGEEVHMREIELKAISERIEDSWRNPPQKIPLINGFLEKVIDDLKHPARKTLVWQNGFFGARTRKTVELRNTFTSANSPLALYPKILDQVSKYVYLPKEVKASICHQQL